MNFSWLLPDDASYTATTYGLADADLPSYPNYPASGVTTRPEGDASSVRHVCTGATNLPPPSPGPSTSAMFVHALTQGLQLR